MKMQRKIEGAYLKLELETIQKIGELVNYSRAFGMQCKIAEWKHVQIALLSDLKAYQIEQLHYYVNALDKDIDEWLRGMYQSALKEVDKNYKPLVEAGAVTTVVHIPQKQYIDALLRQMIDTNTLITSSIISNMESVYLDIVNEAARLAVNGDMTLSRASMKMAKEWARKGMPVIKDRLGRNLSIEGYASMTMRATQKNIANAITEQRLNEYDIDLVEFSSHLSSRPSHAPYQGRIYSRSGKHSDYPPLSSTSYGEPLAGMVTGINCRHQIYPYVEGFSVQRYKPYDEEVVDKTYREEQLQRRFERQIRAAKREKEMLKSMQAPDEEISSVENRIKNRQMALRTFINSTGRTRRYEREKIAV